MKKSEKIMIIIVLIAVFIGAIYVNFVQAQSPIRPVAKKEIVKRDTLIVTGDCDVIEYVKKDGTTGIKAKWAGYAVKISQKDGDAILEGDDAGLVVEYWNDGEVIVNKIIAVNMRRGR